MSAANVHARCGGLAFLAGRAWVGPTAKTGVAFCNERRRSFAIDRSMAAVPTAPAGYLGKTLRSSARAVP